MGVRVLVVDDSALIRTVLSNILRQEPGIEVAGTAIDGAHAIDSIRLLKPDVVLMDIEMPDFDGTQITKKILEMQWVPIVLCSSISESDSQRVLDGMEAGAVDFAIKPSNLSKSTIQEIVMKIKIASMIHDKKYIEPIKNKIDYSFSKSKTGKKIILIGASTGGPQAIERIITELPWNTPAPILIVQHMPPMFTKAFAERLDKFTDIRIREAKEGDILENGIALIAPGGFHMVVQPNVFGIPVIHLNQEPYELGVRPCINHLFRSVAPIFKENTIAVVLTGMGKDGTDGAKYIKEVQGTVIAESEATATIYGMPKEVFNAGYADEVVDLDKMMVAILQLLDS